MSTSSEPAPLPPASPQAPDRYPTMMFRYDRQGQIDPLWMMTRQSVVGTQFDVSSSVTHPERREQSVLLKQRKTGNDKEGELLPRSLITSERGGELIRFRVVALGNGQPLTEAGFLRYGDTITVEYANRKTWPANEIRGDVLGGFWTNLPESKEIEARNRVLSPVPLSSGTEAGLSNRDQQWVIEVPKSPENSASPTHVNGQPVKPSDRLFAMDPFQLRSVSAGWIQSYGDQPRRPFLSDPDSALPIFSTKDDRARPERWINWAVIPEFLLKCEGEGQLGWKEGDPSTVPCSPTLQSLSDESPLAMEKVKAPPKTRWAQSCVECQSRQPTPFVPNPMFDLKKNQIVIGTLSLILLGLIGGLIYVLVRKNKK